MTGLSVESIATAIIAALSAIVWRDLNRRVQTIETKQAASDLTDVTLREAVVKLTVQVDMLTKALEHARMPTGSHRAVSDDSGPHKVGQ